MKKKGIEASGSEWSGEEVVSEDLALRAPLEPVLLECLASGRTLEVEAAEDALVRPQGGNEPLPAVRQVLGGLNTRLGRADCSGPGESLDWGGEMLGRKHESRAGGRISGSRPNSGRTGLTAKLILAARGSRPAETAADRRVGGFSLAAEATANAELIPAAAVVSAALASDCGEPRQRARSNVRCRPPWNSPRSMPRRKPRQTVAKAAARRRWQKCQRDGPLSAATVLIVSHFMAAIYFMLSVKESVCSFVRQAIAKQTFTQEQSEAEKMPAEKQSAHANDAHTNTKQKLPRLLGGGQKKLSVGKRKHVNNLKKGNQAHNSSASSADSSANEAESEPESMQIDADGFAVPSLPANASVDLSALSLQSPGAKRATNGEDEQVPPKRGRGRPRKADKAAASAAANSTANEPAENGSNEELREQAENAALDLADVAPQQNVEPVRGVVEPALISLTLDQVFQDSNWQVNHELSFYVQLNSMLEKSNITEFQDNANAYIDLQAVLFGLASDLRFRENIALMSPLFYAAYTENQTVALNDYLVAHSPFQAERDYYVVAPIYLPGHFQFLIVHHQAQLKILTAYFGCSLSWAMSPLLRDLANDIADQVLFPIVGQRYDWHGVANVSNSIDQQPDGVSCGAYCFGNIRHFLDTNRFSKVSGSTQQRFELRDCLRADLARTLREHWNAFYGGDAAIELDVANAPINDIANAQVEQVQDLAPPVFQPALFVRDAQPQVAEELVWLDPNDPNYDSIEVGDEHVELADDDDQQPATRAPESAPQLANQTSANALADAPTTTANARLCMTQNFVRPEAEKQVEWKAPPPKQGMHLRSGGSTRVAQPTRGIKKAPTHGPNAVYRGRAKKDCAAAIDKKWRPAAIDVGNMVCECKHCHAMLFALQNSSKCCADGKVEMPALKPFPQFMRNWMGAHELNAPDIYKKERKALRENCLQLNVLLSLASAQVHNKGREVAKLPPVVKINGNIAFGISRVEPAKNRPAAYAQIYVHDNTSQQLRNNFSTNPVFSGLDETGVKMLCELYEWLKANNRIAHGYKSVYQRLTEARANGQEPDEYRLRFVDEKDVPLEEQQPQMHERQKNKPQANELAVLYEQVSEDLPMPNNADCILLFPHARQPIVTAKWSPLVDPLCFILLSPYGELLYYEKHLLVYKRDEDNDDNFLVSQHPEADFPIERFVLDDEEIMQGFAPGPNDDYENENAHVLGDDNVAPQRRKFASKMQQMRYRLSRRTADQGCHRIFALSKIAQVLVVKWWFQLIDDVVDFVNRMDNDPRRPHRLTRAVDVRKHYQDLITRKMPGYQLGRLVRMPPQIKQSEIYRKRAFANAMDLVREKGSPALFITLTANPQWKDYLAVCEQQNANPLDAFDLMNHVFLIKLKEIMRHILGLNTGDGIFGKCVGYIMSLEHQKRGPPHAHLLVILAKEAHEFTAAWVDRFISAQIPDPKDEDDCGLYNIITSYNLHDCTDTSLCYQHGKATCKKGFPKPVRETTRVGDGYAEYRRLPIDRCHSVEKLVAKGKKGAKKGKYGRFCKVYGDQHVVSYNPAVSKFWDGHANVEACYSLGVPAYAIKYVYKGPQSKVFVQLSKGKVVDNPLITVEDGKKLIHVNEQAEYRAYNYLTGAEAHMNMIGPGPFLLSAKVIRIAVHLKYDTSIMCADAEPVEHIAKRLDEQGEASTCFTAYMRDMQAKKLMLMRGPNALTESEAQAQLPTYCEYNRTHNYEPRAKVFVPLQRIGKDRIVSIWEVQINKRELLALRTIVLHKAVTSYEDARTVNGNVLETFVEAAQALGYFKSDLLWRAALDQRRLYHPRRMIMLFAQVLVTGGADIKNPAALWHEYKQYMCYAAAPPAAHETDEQYQVQRQARALRVLEFHLKQRNCTLKMYGLADMAEPAPEYDADAYQDNEYAYIQNEPPSDAQPLFAFANIRLGSDQQAAYHKVVEALNRASDVCERNLPPKLFFLHGAAGTGKTTLYGKLIEYCASKRIAYSATATTGVAAQLLCGGQTLHSRFRIPLDVDAKSNCLINPVEPEGRFIARLGFLIIDECSQLNKIVFDFMLKVIVELREQNPERRLIIVCGGDYRQLLPIVKGGFQLAVQSSLLEYKDKFEWLVLKQNHRTEPDEQAYREFIGKLGLGLIGEKTAHVHTNIVPLMDEINLSPGPIDLLDALFPPEKFHRPQEIAHIAILAPTNATVRKVNNDILDRIGGTPLTYEAVNEPLKIDYDKCGDQAVRAMHEYLAKIDYTGFGSQTLTLKPGVVVMLIVNINVRKGLCNGTRFFVRWLSPDVITCERIGLNGPAGDLYHFCRYKFEHKVEPGSRYNINFLRYQFPLVLAYAMTIHKAQGQTLRQVGISIDSHFFAHGQALVAFSRARRAQDIWVYNPYDKRNIHNVVHTHVSRFVQALEQ